MTDLGVELNLPPSLSTERRDVLLEIARRNDEDHGENFLGMALSGSVGREMATATSDVDVYVVLTDEGGAGRDTAHSATIDEIPYTLSDLAEVAPFHSEGWWFRWSFAWAPVLLDRTGGQLAELLHRQATVTDAEAQAILVDHDRLDGWVNYAFRALKSGQVPWRGVRRFVIRRCVVRR